jgi:predicted cupin superfamily sugar epimerase
VPAGHWQAAIAMDEPCLATCTVAPGFEFADFQMVRDIPGHETAFNGVMEVFRNML